MVAIPYNNRLYKIPADMAAIQEIEEELGALPRLQQKFSGGDWAVTELVSLIHILLSASGRMVDFRTLGTHIIEQGVESYRAIADKWLETTLTPSRRLSSGPAGRDVGVEQA